MSDTDSQNYCAAEVRRFDTDRYLAALFAPDECRPGLFALYAFNLEVAKIREITVEPMLGQMRLQWWRDAVGAIYAGEGPRHSVVDALKVVIERHDLPRAPFDRLIDGREFDLVDTLPKNLPGLEAYAAATSSSLLELALHVLGLDRSAIVASAHHAGIAWGLTGLLRAVPYHTGQRRLYLPQDLLHNAGITEQDVFDRAPSPRLRAAIEPVAHAARAALEAARAQHVLVRGRARAGLLPLVLADVYLARLARAGYDVFDPGLESSRLTRQLRLAYTALRRRY